NFHTILRAGFSQSGSFFHWGKRAACVNPFFAAKRYSRARPSNDGHPHYGGGRSTCSCPPFVRIRCKRLSLISAWSSPRRTRLGSLRIPLEQASMPGGKVLLCATEFQV